jgi:hypothetical protein
MNTIMSVWIHIKKKGALRLCIATLAVTAPRTPDAQMVATRARPVAFSFMVVVVLRERLSL